MKFKIDENLPAEVAECLRANGHDAETVVHEGLGGAKDPKVLDACRVESRAIITLDLDFANIVAYPPQGLPGVVVLRVARQSKWLVLRIVEHVVVPFLDERTLAGTLWIAHETRVRIQP